MTSQRLAFASTLKNVTSSSQLIAMIETAPASFEFIFPSYERLSIFERRDVSFDLGEEVDEASGKVSPLTKRGLRGVNPLGRNLLYYA